MNRPRPIRTGARDALGIIAVLTLAGCELLAPALLVSEPAGSDDPWPRGTATVYTEGVATLSLSGGTVEDIELPFFAGGLEGGLGVDVVFRDDDWALTILGYGGPADDVSGFGDLVIHRTTGGYSTAGTYLGECDVEMTRVDASGIEGTATCERLRWIDMITPLVMQTGAEALGDPRIVDQGSFRAEISFEATAPVPAPSGSPSPT